MANIASTTSGVFTGGSVSVGYGYETAFGTAQGTIDKIFGLNTKVTSLTLNTSQVSLNKLGQVEPSTFAYGTQNGTLSVGFVLSDVTSHDVFKAFYGTAAGAGTHTSPYLYPATNAQGAAAKTFVGNTFSTEIGFQGETDTMTRTVKGSTRVSGNSKSF